MSIYLNIIKKLGSETTAYSAIKQSSYEKGICEAGTPLLHLENKSDKEISSMIENSNYNPCFFKFLVPFIKEDKYIYSIIEENRDNKRICEIGLDAIDSLNEKNNNIKQTI
jgi:hypothetical protein